MVRTLPRQRGRVISILTRTRIKYPLSSSTTLVDFCILPTMSQIPSTTFVFMNHTGILWTSTQKSAFVNTRSWTRIFVSYRCNITKYLSKLQGWLWRIQSTSLKLSKMKRTLWSFWFWILKPFVDLHSCLNVLARISIFKKCGVKNCALIMNFPDRWSFWGTNPVFSLSNSEKLLHLSAKSSMVQQKVMEYLRKDMCFPITQKKKSQQTLEVNLLRLEKTKNSPSKEGT